MGVRVFVWPRQRDEMVGVRAAGTPCLVVVDDGCEPPTSGDCCQDWMWRSGGERELRLRLHHLSLRALRHGHDAVTLDDLGTLRLGLRTVHLPPKERDLVRVLLERFGRPVTREELAAAVWPAGVAGLNVVASRISVARGRLRWLGLEIIGSGDGGYYLRTSPNGDDVDVGHGEEDTVLLT